MNEKKVHFAAITVDNVKPNQFKPEMDQAQIRQVVTTTYPTRQIGTSIFDAEEFNLPTQDYTTNRVTWISIPKGTTIEQVIARLKNFPNARIRRTYDHKPILTENHIKAIEAGLTTVDEIGEKQKVFSPETGEFIFQNGYQVYKLEEFSPEGEGDKDLRPAFLAHTGKGVISGSVAKESVGSVISSY